MPSGGEKRLVKKLMLSVSDEIFDLVQEGAEAISKRSLVDVVPSKATAVRAAIKYWASANYPLTTKLEEDILDKQTFNKASSYEIFSFVISEELRRRLKEAAKIVYKTDDGWNPHDDSDLINEALRMWVTYVEQGKGKNYGESK
jgi:hypothetical protein